MAVGVLSLKTCGFGALVIFNLKNALSNSKRFLRERRIDSSLGGGDRNTALCFLRLVGCGDAEDDAAEDMMLCNLQRFRVRGGS